LQDVELRSLYSTIGTRVHNKLWFHSLSDPLVFQCIVDRTTAQSPPKTLRDYYDDALGGSMHLYGRIDETMSIQIRKAMDGLGVEILAHEVPVFDQYRHFQRSGGQFMETRLDFLALRNGRLCLGDYKCLVGKHTQQHIFNRTAHWRQVVCNAFLLWTNYRILVDDLMLVYANRHQEVFVVSTPFRMHPSTSIETARPRRRAAAPRTEAPLKGLIGQWLLAFVTDVPAVYFDDRLLMECKLQDAEWRKHTRIWQDLRRLWCDEAPPPDASFKNDLLIWNKAARSQKPDPTSTNGLWATCEQHSLKGLSYYRVSQDKRYVWNQPFRFKSEHRDHLYNVNSQIGKGFLADVYHRYRGNSRQDVPYYSKAPHASRFEVLRDQEPNREAARADLRAKVDAIVQTWIEDYPRLQSIQPRKLYKRLLPVAGHAANTEDHPDQDSLAPNRPIAFTPAFAAKHGAKPNVRIADLNATILYRSLHRMINADVKQWLASGGLHPTPKDGVDYDPQLLYAEDFDDFEHVSQRGFWSKAALAKATKSRADHCAARVEAVLASL